MAKSAMAKKNYHHKSTKTNEGPIKKVWQIMQIRNRFLKPYPYKCYSVQYKRRKIIKQTRTSIMRQNSFV